jgi:cysteinyl-tRNA synthetase
MVPPRKSRPPGLQLLLDIVGALLIVVAACTLRGGCNSLPEAASASATTEGHVQADVERSGATAVPDAPGSIYPPPETVRSFDLEPPGWHNFVWTGLSATDPGTALDCIADSYAVAYRLDSNQMYQRYVPGRTDISDMGAVNKYEPLLVLITADGARCQGMPAHSPQEARRLNLRQVKSWAYQIQGLEEEGAIDALADSDYELVVVEPVRSLKGAEEFDTAAMVARLHAEGKLVLAYLDVGEAEDYRAYWGDDWVAPSASEPGEPDFLITVDPDGWSGNYPVAFWDERWKNIVIRDESSLVNMVLDDGFDGVYLDWIEACQDETVAAAAARLGIDPAQEMVAFVQEIAQYGRARSDSFLVISQNATELAQEVPEYLEIIDGLGQEDLSFAGEADTDWGDPQSGDIPTLPDDQEYLLKLFDLYLGAGLPIFCIDYALRHPNVQAAYATARDADCLGYVTQTPLSRLTETPPPGPALPPRPPIRDLDLSPAGWHSLVWTGPSGTDPETALACIDGRYGAAYRWVGSTKTFERWVPDRADISNMGDLNKYDSLLVLITDGGAQCVGMPIDP